MLTVTFHNDGTGDEDIGNYDVTVAVNDEIIWTGRVEGHYRPWGWVDLLDRLVVEATEDKWEKAGYD